MNKEIIKEEIRGLLEALQEEYDAIYRFEGRIPLIEFDILMDNVRKLYESIHVLLRLNDPLQHFEKTSPEPARHLPPKPAVPPGPAPVQPKPPVPADPTPAPSTVRTTDSGVTITISEPGDDEPPASEPPANAPAPVQFVPSGPPTFRQDNTGAPRKQGKPQEMDLFAEEEPTFTIKLKEAREKTLGPKIPSDRIENLKTAISINEKFMFINELFDGNLREYNETIETLNGFKTLDQASDFLDLMRKKNFWNTGSTAFKKLQDLVERRF